MRTVLVALNSSYSHFALSLAYLKTYLEVVGNDYEVTTLEYTIEDDLESVLEDIINLHPDFIGFSCYIWSINEILELTSHLKKLIPHIPIALGGPEVSYHPIEVLEKTSSVDYVISGDGEYVLHDLLENLKKNVINEPLPGLTFRGNNEIISPPSKPIPMDQIPSPYQHENIPWDKPFLHYETSRGCVFKCSFCTSSKEEGVREFSIERVEADLQKISEKSVPYLNILDRSFTLNKERALHIMEQMTALLPKTKCHFEVNPHLLNDEFLAFFNSLKWKQFQFEMGIQSTNDKALKTINRSHMNQKIDIIFKELTKGQKVGLYLDLIIGLPGDTVESFLSAFSFTMNYCPEICQIEVLKILPGTPMEDIAKNGRYEYARKAPYKILKSDHMSYQDIRWLEKLRTLVDRLHNKGWFQNTLYYLKMYHYDSYPTLFKELINYWDSQQLFRSKLSQNSYIKHLSSFLQQNSFDQKISEIFQMEAMQLTKNSGLVGIEMKPLDQKPYKNEDFLKDLLQESYQPIYLQKAHKYWQVFEFNTLWEECCAKVFPLTEKKQKVLFLYPPQGIKCEVFPLKDN